MYIYIYIYIVPCSWPPYPPACETNIVTVAWVLAPEARAPLRNGHQAHP